jgi:hypothetical protein
MQLASSTENLKQKMFTEIVNKKYPWLIHKVKKRRIQYDRAKEIVHDAIASFWKYHIKVFDFKKYPDVDIETEAGYFLMMHKANTYFLCRFFEYISKNSFYYKKFIKDLQEERERDLTYLCNFQEMNETLYSNPLFKNNFSEAVDIPLDINFKNSQALEFGNRQNFQDICDAEDRCYNKQLLKFIEHSNLTLHTKQLFSKYLETLDENVFQDYNITYYRLKFQSLVEEFNNAKRI